jgi:hypothetical protein
MINHLLLAARRPLPGGGRSPSPPSLARSVRTDRPQTDCGQCAHRSPPSGGRALPRQWGTIARKGGSKPEVPRRGRRARGGARQATTCDRTCPRGARLSLVPEEAYSSSIYPQEKGHELCRAHRTGGQRPEGVRIAHAYVPEGQFLHPFIRERAPPSRRGYISGSGTSRVFVPLCFAVEGFRSEVIPALGATFCHF